MATVPPPALAISTPNTPAAKPRICMPSASDMTFIPLSPQFVRLLEETWPSPANAGAAANARTEAIENSTFITNTSEQKMCRVKEHDCRSYVAHTFPVTQILLQPRLTSKRGLGAGCPSNC